MAGIPIGKEQSKKGTWSRKRCGARNGLQLRGSAAEEFLPFSRPSHRVREKESTIATSERLSHLGKTVAKTADRPALIRETLRARQPGSQRRNQRPEKEPSRAAVGAAG